MGLGGVAWSVGYAAVSTILGRYVIRAVVAGAAMVLAVLLALDVLFSLFDELDDVGKGDYGFATAILYLALTVPERVYELFPAAVAIGGVFGLGTLAANAELTVMRAAGVSTARIVSMVMAGGVLLMVVIVVIGEVIAPTAQQRAERLRGAAIAGESQMRGGGGFWVRDAQRYIHVGGILPGGTLRDVTVYEFDDRRLQRALVAETAQFEQGDWRVQNIRSTRLEGDNLRTERIDSARWERLVRPELFQLLAVSPESLSIWRLGRYVDYLLANELDAGRFQLAFWKKIATPMATLVMLLLALPVVFGSLRHVGAGQRIFVGSLIGVSYYLLFELSAHIGIVYGLPAPAAALLPAGLFAVLGLVGLRRAV